MVHPAGQPLIHGARRRRPLASPSPPPTAAALYPSLPHPPNALSLCGSQHQRGASFVPPRCHTPPPFVLGREGGGVGDCRRRGVGAPACPAGDAPAEPRSATGARRGGCNCLTWGRRRSRRPAVKAGGISAERGRRWPPGWPASKATGVAGGGLGLAGGSPPRGGNGVGGARRWGDRGGAPRPNGRGAGQGQADGRSTVHTPKGPLP